MENKINELMLKEESVLTEKEKEFLEIHSNIYKAEVLVSNGIVELAHNLKIMKEKELYQEVGFDSFEEYSESACGIKRSQAYKYIKVLDSLGEEFIHSSGQIGITKLALLSTITSDEREVIQAEVNISDVSVSELKEKIKTLEKEKEEIKHSVKEKNNKINELYKTITDLKDNTEVKTEKEVVDNPEHIKKIESLERILNVQKNTIKHQEEKICEYDTKLLIASSTELTEFGFLFTQVQETIIRLKSLINKIPEESRNKCLEALRKVGEQLC